MDSSILRTPRRAHSSLSNSNSNSGVGFEVQDSTRKRQTKKDDQIRKKIEHDLKKKNSMYIGNNLNGSPTKKNHNKINGGNHSGTVMSLKPSEAVMCKPSSTVYEAAQLMSVTKVNCVLVVSDSDELSGIFTAKDLAFRVVGSNLNANQTTIDQIMTPNPLCAKTTTLASDALNLMVSKGFRHLPVVDDSNQIIGVLDITKCYNEAMTKLERMYESSKKLYDAMEGVNAELGGGSNQPIHVVKYFENLKSLLSGPTLDSVLDDESNPIYCDIKTSVYEASILMKEHRTTAVLIRDNKTSDDVTGIFTSKDIVLRVIARGLSPKSCSVIRVMTPKPSFAMASDSIHHALRQMFEGRYLNLPVVDSDNVHDIIGIVDVLKLTHHTLNQIQAMQSMSSNGSENGSLEEKEGPAWNKFWTSLDNDSESITSSTHALRTNGIDINTTSTSHSDLNPFDLGSPDMVRPSDSISYVGIPDALSSAGGLKLDSIKDNNNGGSIHSFNCNFDEVTYFKFRSPLGRSHRISSIPNDGIQTLRDLIESKFTKKELAMLTKPTINEHQQSDSPIKIGGVTGAGEEGGLMEFAISYIDDEHDVVGITSDQDLKDCVHLMKFIQKNRIDLYIHHPNEDITTLNNVGKASAYNSKAVSQSNSNLIQELILPSALFALATSIIVVFTLSRSRS